MSDYDYDRYIEVLELLLSGSWRDPDDLEIGRDISDVPEVKIIFDGYGDLETDDEWIEGGNKNLESYAIFIHKDAVKPDFIFPEHEMTPFGLIHRTDEEVCIYAWYDVEKGEWEINSLEETSDHTMTNEQVMEVLEVIYKHYFEPWKDADFSIDPITGMPNWPFGTTPK